MSQSFRILASAAGRAARNHRSPSIVFAESLNEYPFTIRHVGSIIHLGIAQF